ncbi:hypothetical protein Daus18300_010187 [Diaporthe australafricana]|uniref:Uncharacterized protein n=1 Tax=Diaporthe australafricana TaxID=127596 RepID=A0ABR3WBH2_9PEZI
MRAPTRKAKVSEHDKERIRNNCWLISEAHGLSQHVFEEGLLLNGTPCPFHATSHAALQRQGYDFDKIVSATHFSTSSQIKRASESFIQARKQTGTTTKAAFPSQTTTIALKDTPWDRALSVLT